MSTTLNAAISECNAASTHFGKPRQRITGLGPDTIGTALSSLPTIPGQANKTTGESKNCKKTDTKPSRAEDAAPDPNTRIAELETATLQQAESIELLAEQHTITIDTLYDEAARLERRLRCMIWLAPTDSAVTAAAFSFTLQAFRH